MMKQAKKDLQENLTQEELEQKYKKAKSIESTCASIIGVEMSAMVLPSNFYKNELLNRIETNMKTNTEKDQIENANKILGGQNDNSDKTETKIAHKKSQTHQTKQRAKQNDSPVSKRTNYP